jgi:hypothetical protein
VVTPYPSPTQEQTRGRSGDLIIFFLVGARKGGGKMTRTALAAGGLLSRWIILKRHAPGAISLPGTTSGGQQSNGPTPVRRCITEGNFSLFATSLLSFLLPLL